MAVPSAPAPDRSVHWRRFYADGKGPWDSGAPSSQLVQFTAQPHPLWQSLVDEAAREGRALSAVEPGCWLGNATRWLGAAHCTFRARDDTELCVNAVGVDLLAEVVADAEASAAAAAAPRARFVQADLMAESSVRGLGPFDFIYDCQCFHVLWKTDAVAAVRAYARLLRPGGVVLTLTGNASEPEAGPTVLTDDELVAAFTRGGWFVVAASPRAGRFDMTEAYAKLPQPPLLWEGLFIRSDVAVDSEA